MSEALFTMCVAGEVQLTWYLLKDGSYLCVYITLLDCQCVGRPTLKRLSSTVAIQKRDLYAEVSTIF